jgi:hypothetical protein
MKKLYVARPAAPPPQEPEPEPEPVQQEEEVTLLRQGSITDPERLGELLDRLTLDDTGRRGNAVSLAFMVKDNGVAMLKVRPDHHNRSHTQPCTACYARAGSARPTHFFCIEIPINR